MNIKKKTKKINYFFNHDLSYKIKNNIYKKIVRVKITKKNNTKKFKIKKNTIKIINVKIAIKNKSKDNKNF
jgi:hypothetical protein